MTTSVAIVTGASSGIGKATALRLARDFSAVVLASRSGETLDRVAEEVKAAGAEALVLELDLSAAGAADSLVSRSLERFGRIDAIVNIAGAVPGVDLFQLSDEHWDAAMALKFHGARRLTLRAWEALMASKGSVIFISGTGADIPNAATAAIGTINAAIEALAKAFADRGLRDGVQVNSVSPGPVMTGRRQAMIATWATANKLGIEEAKARLLAQAGISRYGEPEEIADLIAFTVSPAARWMTGTVLRMDGGEVKSR
ncbi:SDR family oxidoreductase [Bosea sp. BK604]|uniref:SDR family oxidoreductase n=1 Tax=Bosea sp. BK604 TaxID=2512180 RepID=UPI00104F92C0|nr:SDR family oxidoreductase [Bosea sp. BK604]TCR62501.1 NAD(P)-dependent dehydrogenase (short-subunit alcohol dehydrogenase family) [Bosea sp. BK604]